MRPPPRSSNATRRPSTTPCSGSSARWALIWSRARCRCSLHPVPNDWSPGDVNALIGNPFYAVEIDPGLAEPHEPLVSEEDWVAANVQSIEEMGPEPYLRNLLS